MVIKKIPDSKINPAPYNPRKDLKPNDPKYQKLLKSMEEFDYIQPLVWNSHTGNLIGGHQRFKILKDRGDKQILCSVVHLPFEKEKALNIALNKISGDWDNQKLALLLDELIKEPDFDFEVTGFELPEATKIIDDIIIPHDLGQDNFDIDSELRSINKSITKRADIIELGSHRLLCGDSTRKSNVLKLLGEEKPDMIFTDPPYGIDYVAIKDKTNVRNDSSKKLSRLLKVIAETDCDTKYVFGHWKTFVDYIRVLGMPDTLIVTKGTKICQLNSIPKEEHEESVINVVLDYYSQYLQKDGRTKLAEIIKQQSGSEKEDITKARQRAEDELSRIGKIIDNLLDNITEPNRQYVDKRLNKLSKQRLQLEQRLDESDMLSISQEEIKTIVADSMQFIFTLELTLTKGLPQEKLIVLRQSIEKIWTNKPARVMKFAIHCVPTGNLEVFEELLISE
jgi:ParB-like chromosome segregation protein Spo0J